MGFSEEPCGSCLVPQYDAEGSHYSIIALILFFLLFWVWGASGDYHTGDLALIQGGVFDVWRTWQKCGAYARCECECSYAPTEQPRACSMAKSVWATWPLGCADLKDSSAETFDFHPTSDSDFHFLSECLCKRLQKKGRTSCYPSVTQACHSKVQRNIDAASMLHQLHQSMLV